MNTTFTAAPHKIVRPLVNDETYLLIIFILLGGTFIVGCACYSLRITRLRMIESANKGVRRSHIQSYIDDDDSSSHHGISYGESDLSSGHTGTAV